MSKRSHSYQLQESTQIVDDYTAIDLDATFETKPIPCKWMDTIFLQIDCTGVTDNTGQFSVQFRNKSGLWTEMNFNPVIDPLANADDTISIDIPWADAEFYKVKFIPAFAVAADGVCKIYPTLKQK